MRDRSCQREISEDAGAPNFSPERAANLRHSPGRIWPLVGDLAKFDSPDRDRHLARMGPVSCTHLPVQGSVRDLARLKLREGSRRSGIEWLRPLLFEREQGVAVAEHIQPSVPQVSLWHDFTVRMCCFKRTLVCPGELLQAGSTIYRLPRRQGPISWPEATCADPGKKCGR